MKPDKSSSTPLYMQIRDALRSSIADGSLAAGTRLATVAAMAADYEVTQATIRRAIQDLVAEGLVTAHVGRGTFVAGESSTEDPQGLSPSFNVSSIPAPSFVPTANGRFRPPCGEYGISIRTSFVKRMARLRKDQSA